MTQKCRKCGETYYGSHHDCNDIVDDIIDIGIGVAIASLFDSDTSSSSSDSSDSSFDGFDGGSFGGGGASSDW